MLIPNECLVLFFISLSPPLSLLALSQRSKVSAKFGSAFSGISSMRKMFNYKQMEGFESVMSKAEAAKILNVSQHRVDLNRIAKCHRELLMRNHPDRGGIVFDYRLKCSNTTLSSIIWMLIIPSLVDHSITM